MSDLSDKLTQIKSQKDNNLTPENLKAGVTLLGVTGTAPDGATLQGEIDALEAGKVDKTVNVTTASTDLNDYNTTGTYFFNNANTPNNKPGGVSSAAGYLEVIMRNSGDMLQRWSEYGSSVIWQRQKAGSTWQEWYKVSGEKDFMIASINARADVTVSNGWTNTVLTLNSTKDSSGNSFTLTNGKIKVNRACRVRISANVMFVKPTVNTAIVSILVNNNVITSGYETSANSNWSVISLSPYIMDVNVNDTIALAYGADSSNVALSFTTPPFTYLTVEEI